MKNPILISCLLALAIATNAQQSDFPISSGPYLGQKPPGKVAELFADGIIANSQHSFHSNIIFNNDGTEAYWLKYDRNRTQNEIVYSKLENGKWSSPIKATFSINKMGDDAPFLSQDGKRLYFISRRPVDKVSKREKQAIWFSEKIDNKWLEPKPVPGEVNSLDGIHWQFSVDADYNLYFSCCVDIYSAARKGSIYYSKYSEGSYQKPVLLPNTINAPDEYNATPFISPEGDYLIFSRESPKTHKMQIYFSRQNNGEWENAVNISEYIGEFSHNCPIISLDRKYLFFLRYVNSFTQPFWVSAEFIEELRPKR